MPRPRSAVYRMSNTAAAGPAPPSAINHHYASIYKRIRATREIAPLRRAVPRLRTSTVVSEPCEASVREISGNISSGEKDVSVGLPPPEARRCISCAAAQHLRRSLLRARITVALTSRRGK